MTRHKAMRRTGVIFLEALVVLAVLVFVAGGVAVSRLMSGPVDMGFARDYIQEALRNSDQGIMPIIGDIALSWPQLNGPLYLSLDDVRLYNVQGRVIANVDEAALSLSKAKLLLGQISPLALILRQPELHVTRTKSGDIRIGFDNPNDYGPALPQAEQEESAVIERIVSYLASPGRDRGRSPLASLQGLKIENARFMVEDEILGANWILPDFDAAFQRRQDSLELQLRTETGSATTNKPAPYVALNVDMPDGEDHLAITAEFGAFDLWSVIGKIPALAAYKSQDAKLSGRIAVGLTRGLTLESLAADLQIPSGRLDIPDLSEAPVTLHDFTLRADFDPAKKIVNINESGVVIRDIPLAVDGALSLVNGRLSGPLNLKISTLEQKTLRTIWPPFLKGDSSEEWIVHKLSKGTFRDLAATLDVDAALMNGVAVGGIDNVTATFAFDGMSVDYRAPLIPVADGKGTGRFDLRQEKLRVTVHTGKIADIDIFSGDLEFVNIIEAGKGKADIHVRLGGPVATGFDYLAREPIHMRQRFDSKQIKGRANLMVNAVFPTKKDLRVHDVQVDVRGTLDDVFLPAVVGPLPLTGGPMRLTVAEGSLSLSGDARLGTEATQMTYTEFLDSEGRDYKYKVKAKLPVGNETRAALGIDLTDFIDGAPTAEVDYTSYNDGKSEAVVALDLAPAHVFFKPFGVDKQSGQTGQASLKAHFKDEALQRVDALNVSAKDMKIDDAALDFAKSGKETALRKGTFKNFTAGATQGSVDLTVDTTGRYGIVMNAALLDLAPLLARDPQSANAKKTYPPMHIEARATRMRGVDGSTITNGEFLLDSDAAGAYDRFEISATAGKGPVRLTFAPDADKTRVFRFEAADAGAALAAFGVYANLRGGTMTVEGRSESPGARDIVGKASIRDFRVVKAPTLARLVGALSLPGIVELLTRDGLSFGKLESDYHWAYAPQADVLRVTNGSTSGNSVGFTFDGAYDTAADTLNVHGTTVPLSGINNIIGKIPLVGDILTGGKDGGLIAATYTVKGPAKEPKVSVNPLSVLAPGILRRILFEKQ